MTVLRLNGSVAKPAGSEVPVDGPEAPVDGPTGRPVLN
jgi:hypothetical protein